MKVTEMTIKLSDIGPAWDELNVAISKVLVAQPHQMTLAANDLSFRRARFQEIMRNATSV